MLMIRVRQTVFYVTHGGKAEVWVGQLPQRKTAPDNGKHDKVLLKFLAKCNGERILKIGQQLAKL